MIASYSLASQRKQRRLNRIDEGGRNEKDPLWLQQDMDDWET